MENGKKIGIEDINQSFKTVDKNLDRKNEIEFSKILLNWANQQPSSNLGFLDVAAGLGIEAKLLSFNGFSTIAQDSSAEMIKRNHHSVAKIGSVSRLEYPSNSFSGILIKDTWLFLSLKQRWEFLNEANRVLVDAGSILLQSEKSDIDRARYIPHESKFPQTLSGSDFKTVEDWTEKIKQMKDSGDNIFAIEYTSLPKNIKKIAEQAGLLISKIIEYDKDHSLATENRWSKKKGFIVELKK